MAITFKSKKEFNKAVNKHVQAILDTKKGEIAKEVYDTLAPVIATCLYEAYGFANKRQEKFFKYLGQHVECLDNKNTFIDQYEDWCKDNNYTCYKMEDKLNE